MYLLSNNALQSFRRLMAITLFADLFLRVLEWDLLYSLGYQALPKKFSLNWILLSLDIPLDYNLPIALSLLIPAYVGLLFVPRFLAFFSFVSAALFWFVVASAGYALSIQDLVVIFFLVVFCICKIGGAKYGWLWPISVSIIYLTAGYAKAIDPNWHHGTGIVNVLSLFYASWGLSPIFFAADLPDWIWYFFNYTTIALELLLGALILFPNSVIRKFCCVLGICFHLTLGMFMDVGLLGIVMCVVWVGLFPERSVGVAKLENSDQSRYSRLIAFCGSLYVLVYLSYSVITWRDSWITNSFLFPMRFYFGMYTGHESAPIHSRWAAILQSTYYGESYTIQNGVRIYPEDLLYGRVTAIPAPPLQKFDISQLQGGRATFWGRLFLSQFVNSQYFKTIVNKRFGKPIDINVHWEKYYSYPIAPKGM